MNSSLCQFVPCALLALVVGSWMAPEPAAACTRAAPSAVLVGQPANGDRQVPTNAVLYYALPPNVADTPGDYTLRTQDGEPVTLGVTRTATHYVELKPASALQPNTGYRLDAQWHSPSGMVSEAWLTFETGSGPVEQRPEAPRAVLHTYALGRGTGSSCGPMTTGTCVSIADDASYIEYSLIDALGQAQPPLLARGSFMLLPLSHGGSGAQCVELRVRGADGARSELLRLCGEEQPDADLSMLVSDPQVVCTSKGLQWCDSSGHTGIAPGVDVPETEQPDVYCEPRSGAQKSQAQAALGAAGGASVASAQPPEGEGDGGCSALPGRRQNLPGLTAFAMLGYCLLRRRRR